jgi:pantetheine-phosphate adenylyltransferase
MKTIALFCGTFSPTHIGHLNILEKAERIFGKGNVILAIGLNPDKMANRSLFLKEREEDAKILSNKIGREVIVYNKFLHQVVEEYEKEGYDVVIIRGLRNGDDLDYEVNQMRFINDFKKNINVVYITCDKEFEHISSSAIRKIDAFGGEELSKRYKV